MKPMTNETETAASSSRRSARFPLVWKISLLVGLTLVGSSAVMGLAQNKYFASVLDHASWNAILGTVAGDDTVLVISRDPAGGADLAAALLRLAERRS